MNVVISWEVFTGVCAAAVVVLVATWRLARGVANLQAEFRFVRKRLARLERKISEEMTPVPGWVEDPPSQGHRRG